MSDVESQRQRLHADLGWSRLSPVWAKVEIVLGLLSAAGGLLVGVHAVARDAVEIHWPLAVAGAALQTLGVYLALAGHRSHLYQSQTKLAAWLAAQIKLHR
jgi:hypothetical protein